VLEINIWPGTVFEESTHIRVQLPDPRRYRLTKRRKSRVKSRGESLIRAPKIGRLLRSSATAVDAFPGELSRRIRRQKASNCCDIAIRDRLNEPYTL
jgi:hypothetical protein